MKRRLSLTTILVIALTLLANFSVLQAQTLFQWYPRLGNVSTDSIEIVYLTSAESDTYVQYALKTDYDSGKGWTGRSELFQGTLFRIAMKGLMSNSQYVYQVVLNGEPATEIGSFYTAPEEEIEFTFLAYGDTRTHQNKHKLLADIMARDAKDSRFVIHVGDLVANGKERGEWLQFSDAIKELGFNQPFYAAIGNHEYNSEHYYNNLALPQTGGGQNNSEWYSFDYAGVHFMILDTNILDTYHNENVENAVEKQAEWIIQNLEANKDAKWIIAVFHHPIYTSHHRRYPRLQQEWIPIFDKYGVDLVINGHMHIYERVYEGGRNYITTGAGGAPFHYEWEYEPRLAGSQIVADALLQYLRIRVTKDSLIVETVQTHKEADDFSTLNEDIKVIDRVVIYNIEPKE